MQGETVKAHLDLLRFITNVACYTQKPLLLGNSRSAWSMCRAIHFPAAVYLGAPPGLAQYTIAPTTEIRESGQMVMSLED